MNNVRIEHIKSLIDKYGKQVITELIDLIFIKEKINNDYLRSLLIENNVIKKTTKIVDGVLTKHRDNQNPSDPLYIFCIYNGKSQTILHFSLKQSIIPEIFAMLNS